MFTVPTDRFFERVATENGLQHQAHLLDEWIDPTEPSGVGQLWRVVVVFGDGRIFDAETQTDGSVPHPVDILACHLTNPDSADELLHLADLLGPAATAELLDGWGAAGE